jgi:hydrogenase-4 component E
VNPWLDSVLVLLILTNLHLLGSSRISACIRSVAVQAVLLGIISLLAQWGDVGLRLLLLAAVSMVIKAGILPWLLRRAVREVGVQIEVEPIVGFTTSLLLGLGLLGAALHVAGRLPLPGNDGRFAAYKVVDPSFHNWFGLAMALRNQQISDFPLCNKSFNLSYCGCDL